MTGRLRALDLAAIGICTLAWGTTWYAITLQLGTVDPIVSLVYRFGLASVLLFIWCALHGETIKLSAAQHRAALGVGFCTFTIDYTLIYWAEIRVASAVVAVAFATLTFVNQLAFRVVFKERPARTAWLAALLGVAGVALLFWGELVQSRMSARTLSGLGITFGAVFAAAAGNVFAKRGEQAGSTVAASTAWAMAYGALFLSLWACVSGIGWNFEASRPYVLSLFYLAVVGSVTAFLLYYGLARRRGFSSASYVAALAPVVAMSVSTVLEGKSWGALAIVGIALVLAGQWLLLRVKKA